MHESRNPPLAFRIKPAKNITQPKASLFSNLLTMELKQSFAFDYKYQQYITVKGCQIYLLYALCCNCKATANTVTCFFNSEKTFCGLGIGHHILGDADQLPVLE